MMGSLAMNDEIILVFQMLQPIEHVAAAFFLWSSTSYFRQEPPASTKGARDLPRGRGIPGVGESLLRRAHFVESEEHQICVASRHGHRKIPHATEKRLTVNACVSLKGSSCTEILLLEKSALCEAEKRESTVFLLDLERGRSFFCTPPRPPKIAHYGALIRPFARGRPRRRRV